MMYVVMEQTLGDGGHLTWAQPIAVCETRDAARQAMRDARQGYEEARCQPGEPLPRWEALGHDCMVAHDERGRSECVLSVWEVE